MRCYSTMLLVVCLGELSHSRMQENCVGHFSSKHAAEPGRCTDIGRADIAGLVFYPFLARFQREHSPELGADPSGTCDQGTDAQLYCYAEIPEPVRCQPAPNPGMNMSGLCPEVWSLLQLLAPLRTPDNNSELLRLLSRLAAFYCNSSLSPSCPQPKNPLDIEPRCYYPFVQRHRNATDSEPVYVDLIRTTLARFAADTIRYANQTQNSGFVALYKCIVEHLRDIGDYSDRGPPLGANLYNSIISDLLHYKLRANTSRDTPEFLNSLLANSTDCVFHCDIAGLYKDTGTLSFLSNFARFLFFIHAMMPVAVCGAGVRYGFNSIFRYPNRLMIYLALSLFFYGLGLAPHFVEAITGDNMLCNADRSTRSSAELKASNAAQFSCLAGQFGSVVHRAILLFISFAWWQMVMRVHLGLRQVWYCVQVEGRCEGIAVSLTLIWAIISAHLISGLPYYATDFVHGCSAPSGQWNFYSQVVMVAASVALILDGCRHLYAIYRASNVPNVSASHCVKRLKRTNTHLVRHTMVKLAQRYIFFIGSSLACGSTADMILRHVQLYSEQKHNKLFRQINEYARCTMITCGDLEPCQHLKVDTDPSYILALTLYLVLDVFSAALVCGGIFIPFLMKHHQQMHRSSRRANPFSTRDGSHLAPTTTRAGAPSTTQIMVCMAAAEPMPDESGLSDVCKLGTDGPQDVDLGDTDYPCCCSPHERPSLTPTITSPIVTRHCSHDSPVERTSTTTDMVDTQQ